MEVQFKNAKLKKYYQKSDSAIKKFGEVVGKRYIQRINIIKATKDLNALKKLPVLRCHPLKGNRKGQWAINLTGSYRLIFTLEGDSLEIVMIEEVSNHYDD